MTLAAIGAQLVAGTKAAHATGLDENLISTLAMPSPSGSGTVIE